MALEQAPEYREIANKLIDKYPVAYSHIELDKILFLKELDKTPKKYADIRKVGYVYDFITEYKFVMVVYEQVIAGFDDAHKAMLIHHELMHIDESFNKLRKHNIQDFVEIVAKYGCDWAANPNLPNILEDEDKPTSSPMVNADDDDSDEPEII
jgi:predicted metallopeptidase